MATLTPVGWHVDTYALPSKRLVGREHFPTAAAAIEEAHRLRTEQTQDNARAEAEYEERLRRHVLDLDCDDEEPRPPVVFRYHFQVQICQESTCYKCRLAREALGQSEATLGGSQ